MISEFAATKLWIVSQVTDSVLVEDSMVTSAVAAERYGFMEGLSTPDLILAGVGSAIMLTALAGWLARSRRDPLASIPLRPNRLREDSLFLATLVYLTTYLVAFGLFQLAAGSEGTAGSAGSTAGSAAQVAGMAICLWIAAKTFDGGARRFCLGPGGGIGGKVVLTILLTIVALGMCPLVLQVTIWVVRHFDPAHEFQTHSVITALRDETHTWGVTVGLWLGAAVVAPIAEEFFFRGLVQTYLVGFFQRRFPGFIRPAWGGGRWIALVVASLVFGLGHFSQAHAVPALVVLAALFGYAYERTGSLWPPIVMHAAFNIKTLTTAGMASG